MLCQKCSAKMHAKVPQTAACQRIKFYTNLWHTWLMNSQPASLKTNPLLEYWIRHCNEIWFCYALYLLFLYIWIIAVCLLCCCSLHCPIRRGQALWPYSMSCDERLVEMDFEALVYEKTSPYQNICIIRQRMSGNTLFLDGDASQWSTAIGFTILIWKQLFC